MTYFLIADSGSTKTEWALITKQQVLLRFQTKGINPYFLNEKQIAHLLSTECLPYLSKYLNLLQAVYFYGAGCSTKENKLKLIHSIRNVFQIEEVHIWHDILGAARATCKKNKGIVGILGTGSNACVYSGLTIINTAVSYGYLFGDYGSGAHIGKTFVQHYCDNTLPKELKIEFEKAGYNAEKILEGVYQNPMPSRFLASIFPFVIKHKHHSFVKELIENSLKKYFEIQLLPIVTEKYDLHFVGSVATILKEELTNIAKQYNLRLVNVMKHPMDGLIEYHQGK
ncbi:MAG TPA: N-acetylglucosamine kinase [Bacteroidia bacterium]|nr:N-acetylglucosamine kinase [Bacteroidia bacterium]